MVQVLLLVYFAQVPDDLERLVVEVVDKVQVVVDKNVCGDNGVVLLDF